MKTIYKKAFVALAMATMAAVQAAQAQAPLNYRPDGRDFVAVNGHNLFTKSLYANGSDYCVKTSDTPLFKLSLWGKEKVLSLALAMGGNVYQLSAAPRCESRFADGSRRYLVSNDDAWGRWASVEITVCPLAYSDGAIMQFVSRGLPDDAQLSAHLDASDERSWAAQGETYLEIDQFDYSTHTQDEMARTFNIAQRWHKATAERIEIETPDPYINNAMGPLLSASHGDWDRFTWIDGYETAASQKAAKSLHHGNSKAAKSLCHSYDNFMAGSPTRAFELMRGTLVSQMYQGDCPAGMADDAIAEASQTIVQGLFGIQPNASTSRCVIRPGLPKAWTSASIRTPYLIYKYHRAGGKDIYEITQNFDQPQAIVIRQNTGNGEYRDHVGSTQKHQIISFKAITHDIIDAPDTPEESETVEEQLPEGARLQELKLDNLFNYHCAKEHKSQFPIPFRKPKRDHNVAVVSTAEGFDLGFDIKAKGKYSCAYLLMTGKSNPKVTNANNGLIIATYNDGSQETLPIATPTNWTIADYEDHCLIKMPLDKSRKLKTISIVALSDDVEIGLEGLTLLVRSEDASLSEE